MAVLMTGTCLAQTPVIEFPLERQVFQRNAEDRAEIRVVGTAPANTTLVEAKAELGAGRRGKAVD